MISLQQAQRKIEEIEPLQPYPYKLEESLGLICSEDVYAMADCPSVNSSLKDGFAVNAADIQDASENNPVSLFVMGTLTAGDDEHSLQVTPGKAARIMTGASIPDGATSVLSSEFARFEGEFVVAVANAEVGRNILQKGCDIALGQLVVKKGIQINPAHLGLLAAAGVSELHCYRRPLVAIVATGSELVWPGEEVGAGKLAASNMVTAKAELKRIGIDAQIFLLRDNLEKLEEQFYELAGKVDVIITCGGVLDGDKDLTMKAMERLGIEKVFHRVRIGPGKGACMGWVGNTLVFNLPGGPPSNHVSFILLALPGIQKRMGNACSTARKMRVLVTAELFGQSDWTQLFYSRITVQKSQLVASTLQHLGRLEAIAAANGFVILPEGCQKLVPGNFADAWIYGPIGVE